ncbi:MAG: thioredoxin domain-containing protein [Chloroflexi bacterium]|nr:MAG: thioredoxin domain-containing protein [Chloroflexota bacterium]
MADFHFSPRPNRAAEIHWRPWEEAAFEEARTRDKPILLSISAVWCHWCHVMDETTYSDQRVIDLLNRDYVPVRVDNDLRPDINGRYNMGGWPTTAFLTPQGDILSGGTYLPADQMVGALVDIERFYHLRKPEVVARVLEAKKRTGAVVASSAGSLDAGLIDGVLQAVENAYDATYGGFGSAPKFPQVDALLLLAEQAAIRGRPELREMAVFTLRQMAAGGTYDQVEGGFYRYSTTQDWSVPHYEKMLEDHAGLVAALAATSESEILDRTTAYLDRVLRDARTGLYAGSQDADEHYYGLDAAGRAGLAAPYVDRRVYTSWNASLAIAYLEAAARLDRSDLGDAARKLLESLFERSYRAGGGLEHGEGVQGQLGDQVWGLLAAVRAYSAGLGTRWLDNARELAEHLETRYADARFGGYFDRAEGGDLGRLGERLKPLAENAVAALALFELDVLIGEPDAPYRSRGERALTSVAQLPPRLGIMAASFARAYDRYLRPPIKVTSSHPALVRAALAAYPYAVIEPGDAKRAVICIGTLCLAPVDSAEAVTAAITEQSHARS